MGLLAYGLIALAIIAGLGGLYGTIHHSGVAEGRAEVEARWQAANDLAAKQAAERRDAAAKTAAASAAALAAAQQESTVYASKWRAERAKHANATLAGCSTSSQTNATGRQGTLPSPASRGAVRFSNGFLRLWDAAWTGPDGQPVFPDPAPSAIQPAASPDALSGIGPGEVLDNHQANAESCSRDRRALDSLIDQVEKLRAGWR